MRDNDDNDNDDDDRGFSFGRLLGTLLPLVFLAAGTTGYYLLDGVLARNAATLDEASPAVVSLPDASRVDTTRNGALVHVSGALGVEKGATDPVFGIAADAVFIGRRVLYYQWVENDRRGGDNRGLTYERRWTSAPVDSSKFRIRRESDDNFIIASVRNVRFPAKSARLGAYEVDDFLKTRMPGAKRLPVEAGVDTAAIARRLGLPPSRVHLYDGGVYLGDTPGNAKIGDIRVRFEAAWPDEASVICALRNDTLTGWRASNGQQWGLVSRGAQSAARMLLGEYFKNHLFAWAARAVLALLFFLMFTILKGVRECRRRGVLFLALGFAFLVMAACWIAHRGAGLGGFGLLATGVAMLGIAMSAERREENEEREGREEREGESD